MEKAKQSLSRNFAETAVRSLIEEVELTPKPGLVDSRNTGAHQDLTIQLMRESAESLRDTFEQIALVSYGRRPSQSLREEIALIGRAGEARMLQVTGGVNTHKGAIWAMGLLVSAAAMGKGTCAIGEVAASAGELACFPDRHSPNTVTNGVNVVAKYGVSGAKGEAQQGFPHVVRYSLPMLNYSRISGQTEEKARLNALLSLMAHLDDTCILHRGGPGALDFAKKQAALLLENGATEDLYTLDEHFISRNISPGGSADLLAATLFLDELQANERLEENGKEYEYIY
ncbi:triphosphoribosyl-dephospho-CoA synthase [Planococcus sp. ISL-109]|uniref:triphosphoribosyl-dephospho-CoA synthase n=1 Tax=Planococcus sp. ISL-109 TaxID=2819166 RepID=UPI001BEAE7AF|nr:triphosphoribosyl-dephospho-CoA synthase [Planococcus sp. ISL-109]MBT2582824.1 triphosphoribosyl-dephospho-CoA synthase [Planococcus sp. ISL-109]